MKNEVTFEDIREEVILISKFLPESKERLVNLELKKFVNPDENKKFLHDVCRNLCCEFSKDLFTVKRKIVLFYNKLISEGHTKESAKGSILEIFEFFLNESKNLNLEKHLSESPSLPLILVKNYRDIKNKIKYIDIDTVLA